MRTSLKLLFAACFFSSTSCSGTATTDCATVTDTWSSYGENFFATNCITCHEHTSDFGTQSAVVSRLDEIEQQISSGQMPEDTTLSSTEKSRVLAWLSCGAP